MSAPATAPPPAARIPGVPAHLLPGLAAVLFSAAPAAFGGVVVRAPAGPARDRWLARLRALLPPGMPVRRVPPSATDDRLLGGLDLPATLAAGRPVLERGVLAEAHGGVVVVPMAERMTAGMAAQLAAALDAGEVVLQRDGVEARLPARVAVVLLDESEPDEAGPPAALTERLAFRIDLAGIGPGDWLGEDAGPRDGPVALTEVALTDSQLATLVGTAAALGVGSLRGPLFAATAARGAAALDGRLAVSEDDLAVAVQLVLAPRATRLPPPPEAPEGEPEPPPPEPGESDASADHQDDPLADRLVEAARAALPPALLARLADPSRRATSGGRARGEAGSATHGRRVGTRRGDPRRARLDLLATLRAAAPWQRLRGGGAGGRPGLAIRPDDFRVRRLKRKVGTTVIVAVDASGSQALHRLGEAKGAVELLLAEAYVRRDKVALIAFRGRSAELVLPPTRSLARAKRTLAGLPGGGGTPLALAFDAALLLALAERRGGGSPLVVLLTDGKANVARDGSGGRGPAEADALAAAAALRAAGIPALLVDTSPRPAPFAARVAAEAGARYLPLPHADARGVGAAVRMAVEGAR